MRARTNTTRGVIGGGKGGGEDVSIVLEQTKQFFYRMDFVGKQPSFMFEWGGV